MNAKLGKIRATSLKKHHVGKEIAQFEVNVRITVTSKSAVVGAYGNASNINCSSFNPIVYPCMEGIFFSARW